MNKLFFLNKEEISTDLHTHSRASDGILSPAELVDHASDAGIKTFALTDHDTVEGLREAAERSSLRKINFIPGIEFSIKSTLGSLHLLGYNIDYTNEELRERLASVLKIRGERIFRMVEDLVSNGISINIDDVLAEAAGGSAGRPHVARVLIKNGFAADMDGVFRKFLVRGKPGYVPKEKIELNDAISLIKKSGGVPVLAHPGSLRFKKFTEFENILEGFVDAGVAGIEAYTYMHSSSDIRKYLSIAKKYRLMVTGGSDFHGDKNERIGFYAKKKAIPASCSYMLLKNGSDNN